MPTAKEFAREVEALALTVTGYQTGKSGQNGLCDCIGLIMGAMARLGGSSYPMHSTNYFARYQMDALRQLVSSSDELRMGHLLYKARSDTSNLNERYQPGGRYYTGDMLDYYHVGVVTDDGVLEITHCTQDGSISGIKRDSSAKGWTHVGELHGVDYTTDIKDEGNEEDSMIIRTAYVVSEDGKPVRMRSMPTTEGGYNTIKKISTGTVVDVLEQADGWAKIEDPDGEKGYMMVQNLKFLEYADEEVPEGPAEDSAQEAETSMDEVTITLPKSAAEALYNAFMKAGWE